MTPKLQIDEVTPAYGVNYNEGYIGFTYQKTSIVSRGIAYITRWARMSDVKVSHAFVVTGDCECVEAIGKGVGLGDLNHYFDDPQCQVFFRKPMQYNADVASRISQAASAQIGKAYDHSLIPAHFLLNAIPGKIFNTLTLGLFGYLVMKIADSKDQWICSELAAYSLDQQPEYQNRGILRDANETIDPQELFEDDEIFTPWKNNIG